MIEQITFKLNEAEYELYMQICIVFITIEQPKLIRNIRV